VTVSNLDYSVLSCLKSNLIRLILTNFNKINKNKKGSKLRQAEDSIPSQVDSVVALYVQSFLIFRKLKKEKTL